MPRCGSAVSINPETRMYRSDAFNSIGKARQSCRSLSAASVHQGCLTNYRRRIASGVLSGVVKTVDKGTAASTDLSLENGFHFIQSTGSVLTTCLSGLVLFENGHGVRT
eukprot:46054-Eustigmatos_ZCMA.PRE.1